MVTKKHWGRQSLRRCFLYASVPFVWFFIFLVYFRCYEATLHIIASTISKTHSLLFWGFVFRFPVRRNLRMKLNKEKLHGAKFIGNWLSLSLRYELYVLVWLVFFTVFILTAGEDDVSTQNIAWICNKRKNICLHDIGSHHRANIVIWLIVGRHWSKSGPIGWVVCIICFLVG
jgi:hypothetical protein